ncbi:sulfatase family protein [Calycomorphotria hydatis]|uniref:Arylsulfatase n=1 Tax=Calycomorphotria hydatis TaxID=2528027 RepID=A0A517TF47_9PLAN|nr:arylsulfatase [Calycomorphotria hydatis]QDT66994.1 Arylsulfatase [Calycomorphotria hydatis]
MRHSASLLCVLLFCVLTSPNISPAAERPHVLVILADDLGYGDLKCYNPDSKIETPHLNQLAAEGMRFTEGHAGGNYCIPSRYALVTGQYPFRSDLKYLEHRLIQEDQPTIATLAKQAGYRTSMVGKWHLGFDGGYEDRNFTKPLPGSPVDCGFETYFGIPASLDIPPYYFIEGRYPVAAPSEHIDASSSPDWNPIQGAFWREGGIAPGYRHEEVLDRFFDRAIKEWEHHAKLRTGKPFFQYLALTAPHTPWLPKEEFRGKSEAGMYGDFAMQVDAGVGRVLDTLERIGLKDNTLVLFSSDNGPVWYEVDRKKYEHSATGELRGMKSDLWEGGHKMPLLARWPKKISAGSICDNTIGFVDLLPTLASLWEEKLPEGSVVDGIDVSSAILGSPTEEVQNRHLVMMRDAVIQYPWKLIRGDGTGGLHRRFADPKPERVPRKTLQLYNLETDPSETTNVAEEYPEKVKALEKLLP